MYLEIYEKAIRFEKRGITTTSEGCPCDENDGMAYLHEHVSLAHPPNLGIILIHQNKVVAVISIFSTFQNWNEVVCVSGYRDYILLRNNMEDFPL